MTHTRQDLAARRRGELSRDRASRRLSSVIDAQRRLNARRALGPRSKADRSVRAMPASRTSCEVMTRSRCRCRIARAERPQGVDSGVQSPRWVSSSRILLWPIF